MRGGGHLLLNLTIALKRTRSEDEHRCAVCGARFAPIEDSGSRILSVKNGDQETVTAITCGGCHSKWSGGTPVTLKAERPATTGETEPSRE